MGVIRQVVKGGSEVAMVELETEVVAVAKELAAVEMVLVVEADSMY